MNVHQNAKTTYQSRLLIVARHEAGWRQQAIADSFGHHPDYLKDATSALEQI